MTWSIVPVSLVLDHSRGTPIDEDGHRMQQQVRILGSMFRAGAALAVHTVTPSSDLKCNAPGLRAAIRVSEVGARHT